MPIVLIILLPGSFIFLIPYLILKIISCPINFFKYGFCFCDCCLDDCCNKKDSIETVSDHMYKKTEDISSPRKIFKYLWPLFLFFILFSAVCIFNAVFMFKFEDKEAPLVIEDFKFNFIDLNGIEKWLWVAFASLVLLILIVVTFILLKCKHKHTHKFSMDKKFIKLGLLSERPFKTPSKKQSKKIQSKDNQSTSICSCLIGVILFIPAVVIFLIFLILLILEVLMPFLSLMLNFLLLVMLCVFSIYVWCLDTNGFFKFILLYYAKITVNIFSNIITAIRVFTNCTLFSMTLAKKDDDDIDAIKFKTSKILVFFKYVLFKNIFNCLEIAFFDMSTFLFVLKIGKY